MIQLRRPAAFACLVAPLLLHIGAPIVSAQPVESPATRPSAPAELRQVIKIALADLGNSEACVREAARARLTELKREDLPALQAVLRKSLPLSPSQITALRQIVQEVYLEGEVYEADTAFGHKHGFMGILMDGAALHVREVSQQGPMSRLPGVVVADRIPGFCASRVLRDGDVILGTVHPTQMFGDPQQLAEAIKDLEPGTPVRLQVLRQGQMIEVTLKLDSRPANAESLEDAQKFRHRRAALFDDYWQREFAPMLREVVG